MTNELFQKLLRGDAVTYKEHPTSHGEAATVLANYQSRMVIVLHGNSKIVIVAQPTQLELERHSQDVQA